MQTPKQLKRILSTIQENAGKMYAREIAEKAGCSYDVIRYYAKELGIDITAKHLIVDEKVKKIIELKDLPLAEIAKRLNFKENLVRYHLVKHGIEPIRTRKRAEIINTTGFFQWNNRKQEGYICPITGFYTNTKIR